MRRGVSIDWQGGKDINKIILENRTTGHFQYAIGTAVFEDVAWWMLNTNN